jgi:hypothetical protein
MTKRFLVPLSTDHVDFNIDSLSDDSVGRLRWLQEYGTLSFTMTDESVQSVGMHSYMPPTKNNSGETITKGSFVMATGSLGDRITIAKAVTDGTVDPMYMIGISGKNIPNESEIGLVTTNGVLSNLNTAAWSVGDILYPDPNVAGGLINVKPNAPAIRTGIAIVLRSSESTGIIYVRMTNGSTLGGTDSNVKFENILNGDTILYNDVLGVWENSPPPSPSTPSGSILPETASDGTFFYNTTNEKLYFYFNGWQEVSTNTLNEFDGGNSSTTEFAFAIDGGSSSDTQFEPIYDGGGSSL